MAISEEDQKFIQDGLTATGGGGGGTTPQCYDDVTCPPNYICVTGNCVEGCTSSSDCPAGYVCFNGRCRLADVPSPTPTPTPTGTCQADGDCRPGYICDVSNPTFPTGDLSDPYGVCRQASVVYCNMTDQSTQCATVLDDTWEGQATRTVNVLVNGQPTPANCTVFPGIPTDWDTSECIKKTVDLPRCLPTGTFLQCVGTTGVYSAGLNDPVTKECITGNQLNDARCVIKIECPPNGQFLRCENGYISGGTKPTNAVFSDGGIFGVCGEYRGNLQQCEIPCVPLETPVFEACDGTTGIYTDNCTKYSRLNDIACEVPVPTPTPTPTPTDVVVSTPIPTPTWRDCVSGNLNDGNAPSTYREKLYTGAGGGTCWEPSTIIGFSPSLNEALIFSYERGSVSVPQPKSVTVTNPSYAAAYRITLTTNPEIKLNIGDKSGAGALSFTVEPRKNVVFSVNVTPQLLDKLGDGSSDLDMKVEIQTV